MLDRPSQARLWLHFLVNTPTIVATVDAALAAAIVVLVLQVVEAPRAALVADGVVAFLAVWGTLFPLQRHTLHPLRHKTPKFPTPQEVMELHPLRSRGAAWVGSFGVGGLSRGLRGGDGRPASFLGSSPAGVAFNQGALVVRAECRLSWVSAPRRSGRAVRGIGAAPARPDARGKVPPQRGIGPGQVGQRRTVRKWHLQSAEDLDHRRLDATEHQAGREAAGWWVVGHTGEDGAHMGSRHRRRTGHSPARRAAR